MAPSNKTKIENKDKSKKTKTRATEKKIKPEKKKNDDKRFKCDVCDKHYKLNSILEAHKRIHTGERPFKCEHCEKAFTQLGTLIVHRRIHTGEKPFKCEECSKQFDQSSAYKNHKYIHDEKKTFKCPNCDKAFKTPVSLSYHKKTHDPTYKKETKVFTCKICDAKIRRGMSSHMTLHTKRIRCQECGKSFPCPKRLELHEKSHESNPEGKYKCRVCEARFDNRRYLSWHNQIHVEAHGYVCNYCGWRFLYRYQVKHHVKKDIIRNFKQGCGEFISKLPNHAVYEYWPRSREKSAIMERLKRLPCNFCDITLPNVLALQFHEQFHHVGYKFRCAGCNWRFPKQKYLDAHANQTVCPISESENDPDKPPENDARGSQACPSTGNAEDNPHDPKQKQNCESAKQQLTRALPKNTKAPPDVTLIMQQVVETNPDKPSTNDKTIENKLPVTSLPKRLAKTSQRRKRRKIIPSNFEKKNLRERRTKILYREELPDDERDIEVDDSDQDPNWFSESSGDSSCSSDSSSTSAYDSSKTREKQGEIYAMIDGSENIRVNLTESGLNHTSTKSNGSIINAQKVPVANVANQDQKETTNPMANEINQETNVPIASMITLFVREPEETMTPLGNVLNQQAVELMAPANEPVGTSENGLERRNQSYETNSSPMVYDANRVKQEVDSKYELRETLLSQGYAPIRLYPPHVAIKRELKIKEEPTDD